MEAAPVFASSAVKSGLPPVPGSDQARSINYGHASLASTAEAVREASAWVYPLRQEIGRVIVGQKYLIDRLLVALIANGHVLLEGVPGLAKTLALRTLAAAVQVRFQRIQFTPTCFRPTSWAHRFTILATLPSTRSWAPSSPTLSSRTRSIARQPKCRARCWKRCRNARSLSATTPTRYRSRS